jgi:hypothetical protein
MIPQWQKQQLEGLQEIVQATSDHQWQHQRFPMILLFIVIVSLAIRTVSVLVLGIWQQEVHQKDVILSTYMIIRSFSAVYCSQKGMTTVITPPQNTRGFAVDCGIADIPPSDGTRMTARAVAHQGIFENAFSNESTASKPDPLTCKPM